MQETAKFQKKLYFCMVVSGTCKWECMADASIAIVGVDKGCNYIKFSIIKNNKEGVIISFLYVVPSHESTVKK